MIGESTAAGVTGAGAGWAGVRVGELGPGGAVVEACAPVRGRTIATVPTMVEARK